MRFTIGRKLAAGYGLILFLMLVGTVLSFMKLDVIRENQDQITRVRIPSLEAARKLQRDLYQSQNKGRQYILAAGDSARSQTAQKLFKDSWDEIDKDIAELDNLSPHWVRQENRDRLAEIKKHTGTLLEVQENAMTNAALKQKDAIVLAGNEFADNATAEVEPIKASLDALSDSLIQVLQDNKEALSNANRSMVLSLSLTSLFALLVGILVAFLASRRISGGTLAVLERAEAIAAGDLTREDLPQTGDDELTDLAAAMNRMSGSLKNTILSIAEHAQHVASASEELSSTGQQISANSEETSAQAGVVSDSAQRVSQNLQSVSSGAEEMSSTIQSIATNAHEAATIASNAVQTAHAANTTVGKLGDSSAEIGEVIKVITSIAQQTNLLALNATIEAARAGEAGKGFAVVANEVKELAKQTAKATEDISRKITAIQTDTRGAVEAIGSITGVIGQINDISGTIATAVEEQSATTNEIARNVGDAAKGSGEITRNIEGVAQAARGTSTSAQESLKAANELAEMAVQLRSLVSQFKTNSGEHAQQVIPPQLSLRAMRARAGQS